MGEWTLAFLPYVLGVVLAVVFVSLRPLGRRLAPLYAGSHGIVALAATWALAATGMWAAFAVSGRSIVLAIALVLGAPLAAGLALLAFRDARRAARGSSGSESAG